MARQEVMHVWGRREDPQGMGRALDTLPLPHPPPRNTPVSAAHVPAAGRRTPLGLSVSKPQMTEFFVPKAALGLVAALPQPQDISSLQEQPWGLEEASLLGGLSLGVSLTPPHVLTSPRAHLTPPRELTST